MPADDLIDHDDLTPTQEAEFADMAVAAAAAAEAQIQADASATASKFQVGNQYSQGSVSTYDQKIAHTIYYRLADGESLRKICRDLNMPDRGTIIEWYNTIPEFRDLYDRARRMQLDLWAEEIIDIADDGTNDYVQRESRDGRTTVLVDFDHINRSKLRVDARKWMLASMQPKKYGTRVEMNSDVTVTQQSDGNNAKVVGSNAPMIEHDPLHKELSAWDVVKKVDEEETSH